MPVAFRFVDTGSDGSDIHGYWLLDRDVRSHPGRALITALLPHFYRSFGGDHVQNLSRILRPPGTVNCKDARNGRPQWPCTLLRFHPHVHYPLEAFACWIAMAKREQPRPSRRGVLAPSPTDVSPEKGLARKAELTQIVRNLDRPSRDRSRRDFAVVCDLLRLGLTREEIWAMVAASSKFESHGRPYFDATVANADRSVRLDSGYAARPRAST